VEYIFERLDLRLYFIIMTGRNHYQYGLALDLRLQMALSARKLADGVETRRCGGRRGAN
jgi:hypothetical protein